MSLHHEAIPNMSTQKEVQELLLGKNTRFRRAGEMVQSGKYLPSTHEDWSSNPMLKLGMVAQACHFSSGVAETGA